MGGGQGGRGEGEENGGMHSGWWDVFNTNDSK